MKRVPEGRWDSRYEGRGVSITAALVTHVRRLNARYDVYQGTSMAAPHVAGVAAMVRAYWPYATAKHVVAAIKAGARPVEALKSKTVSGGVLNALGALSVLVGPTNVSASVER